MSTLLVAGATGAIGQKVVREALKVKNHNIKQIIALTRKKINFTTDNNNNNKEEKIKVYNELFDLDLSAQNVFNNNNNNSNSGEDNKNMYDIEKLKVVTFDWEKFYFFWKALSQNEMVFMTTKPHKAGQEGEPKAKAAEEEEEENADDLENSVKATDEEKKTFQRNLAFYKSIFHQVHIAVCAMGTTRKDAGSAESFMHTDYDYVTAFFEFVLMLSGRLPATLAADATAKEKEVESRRVPFVLSSYCDSKKEKVINDAYTYHIGDHLKPIKRENNAGTTPPVNRSAVCYYFRHKEMVTSQTLNGLFHVSSYNADPSSFFLYMQTKGVTDEALMERVLFYNRRLYNKDDKTNNNKNNAPLYILRPGLLERGDKKLRFGEKVGKIFMKSIPVESCGQCVISTATTVLTTIDKPEKRHEVIFAKPLCTVKEQKEQKNMEKQLPLVHLSCQGLPFGYCFQFTNKEIALQAEKYNK